MRETGHATGDTRSRVLAVVRAHGTSVSIAELAQQLEVHANTIRFHLETLIERGLVEQVETRAEGPGRPALRVRAVAAMDPDGPRNYAGLAHALVSGLGHHPDGARLALDTGRAWGAAAARAGGGSLEPVARLTEILDDLGFAPEHATPGQIGLRHCPFLEVAKASPDVVCPVHLGMMRGVLDELGSQVTVERLQPFETPDRCVAHLRTAARQR